MKKETKTISEIVTAGFELHKDGESTIYSCWAKNAAELAKVKKLAENFKRQTK